MEGQNHPLYLVDRDHVNRLLAKEIPVDQDLIDIARLFMRYEGFPGANDIQMDMLKTLKFWGLSKEQLNTRTKEIWSKGFRPGNDSEENVGSGFDTSDNNDS